MSELREGTIGARTTRGGNGKAARIRDAIAAIEAFAPLGLQAEYDNSGLALGDPNRELTGVMVTLDTNCDVVEEAKEKGCNLIVEHHPIIFRPLASLDLSLPKARALICAATNGIAIYSSHTCFDFCPGGLSDFAAKQAGLVDVRPAAGLDSPRIGRLRAPMTLSEYAEWLKRAFDDENVVTIGDPDKPIRVAAVANGGGGGSEEWLRTAISAGADAYLTGDVKYSVARLAKDSNYGIIQIGHYNAEQGFLTLAADALKGKIGGAPIFAAQSLADPYNRRRRTNDNGRIA